MAIANRSGRVNYEPNSWPAETAGPRESATAGFASWTGPVGGAKRRERPESFSDHYSQARQFYLSQAEVERAHIVESFVFELGKVERLDIRERMVAGLRNVDDELAGAVAEGLGMKGLPDRLSPAREPLMDLAPSPSLSIVDNPPGSFAGRKLGVLVSDGTDAGLLQRLRDAGASASVAVEAIGPRIGGVVGVDGSWIAVDRAVLGSPSALFDAVAILALPDGGVGADVIRATTAFVKDAYAQRKFIAYSGTVVSLIDEVTDGDDDGVFELEAAGTSCEDFLNACRRLRAWTRVTDPRIRSDSN